MVGRSSEGAGADARRQERQALALLLHDTTLQGLIAILWQVDALTEESGASPALAVIRANLEALVDETRVLAQSLREPVREEDRTA